jgi:hypothetical protein
MTASLHPNSHRHWESASNYDRNDSLRHRQHIASHVSRNFHPLRRIAIIPVPGINTEQDIWAIPAAQERRSGEERMVT